MGKKPHFIKVLVGNFSDRLRIPPAFLKNLSEESSNRAVLIDPVGRRWRVKLKKINATEVYFNEGWEGFVENHSLKEAYFIVFKYLGNLHFGVDIIDRTHCSVKEHVSFKAKNISYGHCYHPHSSLIKATSHSSKKRPIYSSTDGSKVGRRAKTEGTDHSSSAFAKQQPDQRAFSRKGSSELRTQKTNLQFDPKNPSFKRQIKGYNVSGRYLMLPFKFARAHMPSESSSIELRNCDGHRWFVSYLVGKLYAFSRGWSAVVRDNGLKVGDELTFELVDDNVMHFHTKRRIYSSAHGFQTGKKVKNEEILQKQLFKMAVSIDGGSESRAQKTNSPFLPNNPSFRSQMKAYNLLKGMLVVPADFADAHMLSEYTNVKLWNGDGQRSWYVRYLDRQYPRFSAGWPAFVQDNALKIGDVCVFELVEANVMHFHVIRNGKL